MGRCCFVGRSKAKGKEHIMDKNVTAVVNKMFERANTGLKKYGVTTERTDLTNKQWLIHAQEEAMDLAIYLQRIIDDTDD